MSYDNVWRMSVVTISQTLWTSFDQVTLRIITIPVVWQVYIPVVWQVYIWYMSSIYWADVLYLDINQVYVRYITVYVYYTWRLVLLWWARPHTAWTTSNNVPGPSHDALFLTLEPQHPLHLLMWQWTARFEDSTFWARGPDPNRCGTDWKNRPEADVSIAFKGLVPCLNTNCTFKHQRHWLNTNGTFRFFKFEF